MPADFRIHFGAAILEFERHFHAQTAIRNIAANPPASRKFLGGWLKRNNVLRKLVGEPETKTQII